MAEQIDVYQTAYRAAQSVFRNERGTGMELDRALSVARGAVHQQAEPVILAACEAAWKARGEVAKEPDPSRECPQCRGAAASFWMRRRFFASCDTCRVYWALDGLDFSISESPFQTAEAERRVKGFARIDKTFSLPL